MTNIEVYDVYYNAGTGEDFIIPDQEQFFDHASFSQEMTIATDHSGDYVLPLTQQETFALHGVFPLEARIKFADQTVVGTSLGVVNVEESQSREVL